MIQSLIGVTFGVTAGVIVLSIMALLVCWEMEKREAKKLGLQAVLVSKTYKVMAKVLEISIITLELEVVLVIALAFSPK